MTEKAIRIEQYRDRAEELCTVAESMKDPQTKRLTFKLAEEYEKMAEQIERMDLPICRFRYGVRRA